MNQEAGLANTGDILYPMRVMLFVTLLCTGYLLSRPTTASKTEQVNLLPATTAVGSPEQEWTNLPPWQRKASEKAIEKYATTQDKKWRRWNEAMFERLN